MVIHFFRSKTFCPTEPKKIVGEAFFVSHNFWYRKKFMEKREGSIRSFRRKFFVSLCRKKFVGNPFVLHYFWVSTNLMLERTKSQFSFENFFLTKPKTFVGDPFSFSLNSGMEKH